MNGGVAHSLRRSAAAYRAFTSPPHYGVPEDPATGLPMAHWRSIYGGPDWYSSPNFLHAPYTLIAAPVGKRGR